MTRNAYILFCVRASYTYIEIYHSRTKSFHTEKGGGWSGGYSSSRMTYYALELTFYITRVKKLKYSHWVLFLARWSHTLSTRSRNSDFSSVKVRRVNPIEHTRMARIHVYNAKSCRRFYMVRACGDVDLHSARVATPRLQYDSYCGRRLWLHQWSQLRRRSTCQFSAPTVVVEDSCL